MLIDPELLPYVDEQRAAYDAMREFLKDAIDFDPNTPEGLAKMRTMMEPGGLWGSPLVEEAIERTIPGPAGDIPIRVLLPEQVTAVYLRIHAGWWWISSRSSSG